MGLAKRGGWGGVLGGGWGAGAGKLWWRGAAVGRSEGPCCGVAGPSRDAPGVLLCYYGASVLAGGAGLGRCAAAVPRCGAAVPLGEGGERRCWGRWLCWLWCCGGAAWRADGLRDEIGRAHV